MGPPRNAQKICLAITLSLFLTLSFANPQKKPTTKKAPKAIPYQTVNNFCLHKKLSVNKPFCLRVLKNPQAANAKPNDISPLLDVVINTTSIFICKTLSRLQDLYQDRRMKPSLMPALQECLSAYEAIAEYITNVIDDASQESAIAGLDGEVIEDYINGCVKVSTKKHREISYRNEEAKNYARLLTDVADNLSSSNPKEDDMETV